MDPEEESEVTIMCVELVARDVYDLFRLFQEKLRWVVDNEATAFEGADPTEVKKILDRFKASYEEKYPKIQAFLMETAELLSIYGIKLRTKLEPQINFNEVSEGEEGGEGAEEEGGGEGEGEAEEEEEGVSRPL